MSNTESYTIADWEDDISNAAAAHIDAFVLNIAVGEGTNGASLSNAFTAANNLGGAFKLLLSYDYAGNGLWPEDQVITMIQRFSSNPAYYQRGSQPLVSTFEGPAASADWTDIKAQTNCFFIPSWSSLGAAPALAKGTADGLFSWAAWPTDPNNMNTFTDASYFDTLAGKPYMMGVSPWFYTNMPGFRKNWLWRGGSLWFDRWIHAMYLQPEYVQIITWNDYGESHHIGPLRDKAYVAFEKGRSPFKYVLDKSHDGWRHFLPFLIDLAKTNRTSFSQEMATVWYRQNSSNACGTGGTTGNTAGISLPATWMHVPSDGRGLYRGSVAYGGATGSVVVIVAGSAIAGKPISASCTNGLGNWNANVEFALGSAIAPTTPLGLDQVGCTGGTADPKYEQLCDFSCKYDYCPRGAYTCTSLGTRRALPASRNVFVSLQQMSHRSLQLPRHTVSRCGCAADSHRAGTAGPVVHHAERQLAESCRAQPHCTDQRDGPAGTGMDVDMLLSACPNGMIKVGWDKDGCKANYGKSICYAINSRFTMDTCIWRGGGGDCNGQCHPGEVTTARSSWCGQPTKGNQDPCSRGVKVLCCQAPEFELVTRGCRWTGW